MSSVQGLYSSSEIKFIVHHLRKLWNSKLQEYEIIRVEEKCRNIGCSYLDAGAGMCSSSSGGTQIG